MHFFMFFQTLSVADPDEAREEANFYALLFLGIGIIAAVSFFMMVKHSLMKPLVC